MGDIKIKNVFSFLALAALALVQVETAAWGYEGPTGVRSWDVHYPLCAGDRQSPIDIATAKYDDDLEEFKKIGYIASNLKLMISNNGHSVAVSIPSSVAKSITVSREGLADTYYAFGFHFHWGSVNSIGSEHTFGGRAFPMEMHFIHINSKYANVSQAAMHRDGLLVFGTMFQIAASDSPVISAIKPKLNSLIQSDSVNYIDGLKLDDVFPYDSDDYFMYDGSLTTPGCNQAVSWHLHRHLFDISQATLNEFRKLKAHKGVNKNGLISNNFRPVQLLNNRKIKSSFKAKDNDDDNTTSGVVEMKSHLLITMTTTVISLFLAFLLQ